MWLAIGLMAGMFQIGVAQTGRQQVAEHDARLSDFQAIEFRRYTVKEGERVHFAQYFEAYFPEAFEQLGAIAAGSFFERQNQTGFTWIRSFHTIDQRARSEEHTSELQSQFHLVCRLLLEKKK